MSEHKQREEWERHVKDTLFPMVAKSRVCLQLLKHPEPDLKMLTELAAMIWHNKPIILCQFSGVEIPPGLRRIAHVVLEDCDPLTETGRARLMAAIREFDEKEITE